MDEMILVTGFPGFIAHRLVEAIRHSQPDASFLYLVQEKYRSEAEPIAARLGGQCITGDITRENLGADWNGFLDEITHVWHLAAVYDLTIKREIAERINFDGTRNVLTFCQSLPSLKRLYYISTCYVSGLARGVFREDDLDKGQGFKNHYEWSKFEAEKSVREASGTLPTTIFRPGIVVGDSTTGRTVKADGPYFIMEAMLRMPPVAPFFKIGSGRAEIGIIPIDFLVKAFVHLSHLDPPGLADYNVTDPSPLSVYEVEKAMATALSRHFLYIPTPKVVGKLFLSIPPFGTLLGIPPESVDYFTHDVHYDTTHLVRDLEGSGITCPPLKSYLPKLVEYYRANRKTLRKEAMR